MKFVCCKCGKEMDEFATIQMPCTVGHVPVVHETEFICKKCHGGMNND